MPCVQKTYRVAVLTALSYARRRNMSIDRESGAEWRRNVARMSDASLLREFRRLVCACSERDIGLMYASGVLQNSWDCVEIAAQVIIRRGRSDLAAVRPFIEYYHTRCELLALLELAEDDDAMAELPEHMDVDVDESGQGLREKERDAVESVCMLKNIGKRSTGQNSSSAANIVSVISPGADTENNAHHCSLCLHSENASVSSVGGGVGGSDSGADQTAAGNQANRRSPGQDYAIPSTSRGFAPLSTQMELSDVVINVSSGDSHSSDETDSEKEIENRVRGVENRNEIEAREVNEEEQYEELASISSFDSAALSQLFNWRVSPDSGIFSQRESVITLTSSSELSFIANDREQ